MTLEEEFYNQSGARFHNTANPEQVVAWFTSYLKDFLQSVKLEKELAEPYGTSEDYVMASGYNQALSDHEAKIAEELKKRGI